jgi:hypothetical protein
MVALFEATAPFGALTWLYTESKTPPPTRIETTVMEMTNAVSLTPAAMPLDRIACLKAVQLAEPPWHPFVITLGHASSASLRASATAMALLITTTVPINPTPARPRKKTRGHVDEEAEGSGALGRGAAAGARSGCASTGGVLGSLGLS